MTELKRCAVVRDDRYKNHVASFGHPECPERLAPINSALDDPSLRNRLVAVPPRSATKEELELVHTTRHIRELQETSGLPLTYLDPDTQTTELSFETALLAVGGLLNLIEESWYGRNPAGFAFIRPPGHHAERARAMGFCLFNNVAVGARFLTHHLGAERVLIVDWDLHHGNGTQHIFWSDSDVLYFSLHQFPHYPGTGRCEDVGDGPGKGFTVNVPLPALVGDEAYLQAFHRVLKPIALKFRPDMILVSAGFDAHYSDPLGGMQVTEVGYRAMTRVLVDIARETCKDRLVFALEGGYSFEALFSCVKTVIREVIDPTPADDRLGENSGETTLPEIEKALAAIRPYWDIP